MYLCKESLIEEIENCDVNSSFVISVLDRDYISWNKDTSATWEAKGIYNKCLIAHIEGDKLLQSIFYTLMDNIRLLNGNTTFIFEAVKILNNIDKAWFNYNFASIFTQTVKQIQEYNYNELYSQPNELTQFVVSLVNYKGGAVYNPFAGIANYGIALNTGDNYYAQEINSTAWSIGRLRMLSSNISCDNYFCADSGLGWIDDKLFSTIIATPPMGVKVDTKGAFDWREKADMFFIKNGISRLTDDGILVGVFAENILYTLNETSYIEYLDSVITLPKGMLHNTSVSLVVLSFRKNCKPSDKVRLVDGSSFAVKKDRSNILRNEKLLAKLKSSDTQFVNYVSRDVIVDNNFNLSPVLYHSSKFDVPDGFKSVVLRDILHLHKGVSASADSGRTIKSKDLANSVLNFEREYEDINEYPINESATLLDMDLILVSSIGELRPTYFRHNASFKVFVSKQVLAFASNEDIHAQYIISELSKEYVVKQIEARSVGGSVKQITSKSLLDVKVLIPTLKMQQQQLFEEYKMAQQQQHIQKLGMELDMLKSSKFDEYERNTRLRKHALSQKILGLKSAFSLLKSCFDKRVNNVLRDDDIVSKRTGETVADYFDKLPNYVSSLAELIDKLAEDRVYEVKKRIDVFDILECYVAKRLTNKYRLDLQIDKVFADSDFECDGELILSKGDLINSISISGSNDDFIQVLDNIIANAEKWGFVDPTREDYSIRICVEQDVTEDNMPIVVIRISNNGDPLPKGMDKDKIFHWGIGSGTGLGTCQIKDIVEHFGGKVKLNEYPEDNAGFVIEYELEFRNLDIIKVLKCNF